MWDLETGAELRTLTGHTNWVSAVAVYGEGTRALSASWDVCMANCQNRPKHDDSAGLIRLPRCGTSSSYSFI